MSEEMPIVPDPADSNELHDTTKMDECDKSRKDQLVKSKRVRKRKAIGNFK